MKSNDQNHDVKKSSPHEQKEVSLKKKLRLATTITMIMGIISVLAVILHYLALSDIAKGEADLALEWRIAGIDKKDPIVRIARNKLHDKAVFNKIIFLGFMNESELVDNLCNSNLYVSPSQIENSSNSLGEAMLLGMPCIATFAGGTGSILSDGIEGILVQDGDPWALAGAILELHRNPDTAQQLSHKARERALIRHSHEKIVNDLIKVYNVIFTT